MLKNKTFTTSSCAQKSMSVFFFINKKESLLFFRLRRNLKRFSTSLLSKPNMETRMCPLIVSLSRAVVLNLWVSTPEAETVPTERCGISPDPGSYCLTSEGLFLGPRWSRLSALSPVLSEWRTQSYV